MVEPYAAMLEHLGLGRVIQRTGDVWPGAPGCSLTTTSDIIRESPALVERMVGAYLRAARFVDNEPGESAEIASRFIGVSAAIIGKALAVNRPDPRAILNQDAMDRIIELMIKRGYLQVPPKAYKDLSYLEKASAASRSSAA